MVPFINVCAGKDLNSFVQSTDDIRLLRPLMSISYLQVAVSLKWLVLGPGYHVLSWTLQDSYIVPAPCRSHILAGPICETAKTLTRVRWVICCIYCLEIPGGWGWEEGNPGLPWDYNQPFLIDHRHVEKESPSSVPFCRTPVPLL